MAVAPAECSRTPDHTGIPTLRCNPAASYWPTPRSYPRRQIVRYVGSPDNRSPAEHRCTSAKFGSSLDCAPEVCLVEVSGERAPASCRTTGELIEIELPGEISTTFRLLHKKNLADQCDDNNGA